MDTRLMLLPAATTEQSRLLEMPKDYEQHEAFRHVTAIIAAVEEEKGTVEDILEALEVQGFIPISFLLGPELPD